MNTLNKIFENYFNEWLYLYPFEGSLLGFNILDGLDEIPVTISEEFKKKEINFYKKYIDLANSIDLKKLNEREKIYLNALKFTCHSSLLELSFQEELLPINQFYSLHLIFPLISSGLNQNFKNKNEIENFFKKINFFERWAEEVIVNLKNGTKLKITLPLIIVEKLLEQLKYFIKTKKEKNPCFKPIQLIEKEYKGKNKEILTKNIENEIKNKIIPSYENIFNFLKEEYWKKCKKEIGYHNLPNGDDWYRMKILKYTTINLEPKEIFEYANEELLKLKDEYKLLKDNKIFKGDCIRFLKKLKKELKEKLKNYFINLPKKDFKILPMEKYKEKASSLGEYFLGGVKESLIPIFYINLNLAKRKTVSEIMAIFFHEAMPGHHLQISLQRENKKLPSFLRYHIFDAFVEGWALYSEFLPIEIGILKDEGYKKAVLKNQIWRTIRLILDVGIHTGKFKKDEAIKFLMKEGNFKKEEAEIEVLRYAVLPAQALAYKIGEKTFVELKDEAKEKLKEKFNLKEFHKVLLEDGSLPLNLVKEKIQNWIRRNQ